MPNDTASQVRELIGEVHQNLESIHAVLHRVLNADDPPAIALEHLLAMAVTIDTANGIARSIDNWVSPPPIVDGTEPGLAPSGSRSEHGFG